MSLGKAIKISREKAFCMENALDYKMIEMSIQRSVNKWQKEK